MPRKNKRKFFGKSSKSKTSSNLNRTTLASDDQQTYNDDESEEKCDDQQEENESQTRSELNVACTATTSVTNDSTMGHKHELELPAETNNGAIKGSVISSQLNTVGESAKTPNEQQHKATITLKVIQFVGELPKQTRDDREPNEFPSQQEQNSIGVEVKEEILSNDNGAREHQSINNNEDATHEQANLMHSEGATSDICSEPKIEQIVKESVQVNEPQKPHSFDDNYRVDSPKQCTPNSELNRNKRHAMLIQEISESSSSEDVKTYLNAEATAMEMKIDKVQEHAPSPKHYRVDSPESSDENTIKAHACDVIVQEISESSSSESVRNEILASTAKPPTLKAERAILKIINIKELPSEEIVVCSSKTELIAPASSSTLIAPSSSSPRTKNVSLFECKTDKKLNKAEEAIMEALYGNKSLLQIENRYLDVISEEGSDCGSDIDKQASNRIDNFDELDDVFLPFVPSAKATELTKKPPLSYRRRMEQKQRIVAVEQPLLINTKIIETETNIPESCKSWETSVGDSELQAEVVYLTSASSSATDLSERGDISDSDEVEDTSEDTETNSLLENISVPSYNISEHDTPIEFRVSTTSQQQQNVYTTDIYNELTEQKQLPDILEEEDEDSQTRSIDIVESQQQIEDVNKALHHLVEEHEEAQRFIERKSVERQQQQKLQLHQTTTVDVHEINDIASDKKEISEGVSDNNDKPKEDTTSMSIGSQLKRTNSTDSSSSSNSQCTIIRQFSDTDHVHPLKDLCLQSLTKSEKVLDKNNAKEMTQQQTITIHRKENSLSRNAPQIPIINELEMHYHYDDDDYDLEGRENNNDKVITILQVPPDMCTTATNHKLHDKKRWLGLQSSQIPNLLVALSPLQKTHIMNSQDSTTNADLLLDMHKKFVERRAYHEPEANENSNNTSRIMNILKVNESHGQLESNDQLEKVDECGENLAAEKLSTESAEIKSNLDDSHFASGEQLTKSDNEMNSIRNCFMRDEFFKNISTSDVTTTTTTTEITSSECPINEFVETKQFELQSELKKLEDERRKIEEEMRNLESLQHFKREEFLYNQKQMQEKFDKEAAEAEIAFESNNFTKYANDDFNEFINANEKLQKEMHNEWQHKVFERNERKLHKVLKITTVSETTTNKSHSDRATSETAKYIPLENEFLTKVKERRKRLSLPIDNDLNSSTESLHHQNEAINMNTEKTRTESEHQYPEHLKEFLNYCDEEIKNVHGTRDTEETELIRPPPPPTTILEHSTNPLPYRIAPKFKATIPPTGIWASLDRSENSIGVKKSNSPPIPIWTPKSAPPSPTAERKFRPVPFESPTLERKKLPSQDTATPPWQQANYSDKPYQPSVIRSSSCNTVTSTPKIQTTHQIIYRKARADQFNDKTLQPTPAQKEKSISFKPKPLASPPIVKSNELVYSIKRDFSETKDKKIDETKKMTQMPPKKTDDIGPMTKEGMPLTLRSEMTDESREQWYKKMYNTIHKAKDDDNYVTVKYKTRRGIPYKSNGYASEPDANYDSDYALKYHSGPIDRKRTTSIGNQYQEKIGSMEQPVKSNVGPYKLQPGKIENYTPGHSSVSDKEAKKWWDDIMEIFDGWLDEHSSTPYCGNNLAKEIQKFHLEQQKLASPRYTQGNLSRALAKDQGYQSDSTLVFKKRSDVEQLSPVEQKLAYKVVQLGGEVPLQGFRKQAPEKSKDDEHPCDDDAIPMQRHKKLPYDERAIINSEIICYPITNISRPLDMFGPFPKSVKSFVPVVPPPPPNRKSSRTNSTLKLVTHFNASPASRSKSCSKHDSMSVKFSNSNIKNADINRSRSAGPSFISTYISSSHKDDSRTRLAKRICYRANSSSPVSRKPTHDRKSSQSPVAFGRGISKERAFAEEKKKIEEKLSKISKDLHVSTRILRNPELKSPNEVKKALQTTFKPIAYAKDPKLASIMVRKSLESQAYRHASTSKNIAAKSEQKSLKVTVAISSRGREIMRTSTETPRSLRQPSNASTLSTKSSSLLRNTITDTKSKLKARSKGSAITNSNNSLARTNSTYSIDSNLSRKKQQHDGKARNIPITITSQKMKKSQTKPTRKSKDEAKKSFQDSTMADNRKVMESLNEAIVHQNEAIRSDSFFQKLFLRDIPTRHGANLSRNTSVLEKARMWNALAAYKSEPSLQHPNYYLRHARPVSRSKFREFETQNESESFAIYNRPTDDVHKGGFVMEQIYKYDSLYQLSDEDEFGNSNRGRSLDFSYSYHERSNSEPPKTVLTELTSTRPHSPVVIYGRNKSMESEKRQRSSRSPSCRRIQSLKTNKLMELSSYQKELARAQSVGRTDRAKEKLLNQSAANLYRSKSLNILNYEKHLPICGHKKNERFRDLSEFYACLERIGQLECATSNSDLRPRRRNEEIIDYDLWQKVREYEKNERELNTLLRKLRAEQRDKDFLFQPHAVDEVRWMPDGDLGLVTKEKSVENLKELFQQKAYESESSTEKVAFDGTKDNYKPLWRASSVLDLASNMTQKYNKKTSNTLPKSEMKAEKKLGLSKKLLSTLSKDQLNKIKNQLTEIYSTSNDKSSANVEQFVVTVPSKSSPTDVTSDKSFLTVRSHSELSKDQIQEPSIDITTLKNVFEGKQRTSTTVSEISESEKRSISHSLCEEIKDKFSKRNLKNPDFERVKMIESTVNSMTLPLPKKPKKDISFKFQEAPPAANKYLVDIIPPRKIPAPNETESISSEASNRTVIFREASTTTEDVQGKIKYFEEIERAKENVATTIYHARDDSSPDNGEVNGEIIKEKAQDQLPPPPPPIVEKASSVKSPKLTSSQSFTDFKDFFGERSSMKSSTYRGSSENLTYNKLMKRSRSSSPDSERCYKSLTEFGDVEKLKMKFENYCSADDEDAGCHYIFSDSELNKASMKKTRIRGHEFGNVSHITHKYEMQSKRARSRTRRISPILRNPIKRDDRLMPHINIISKTASLKNHQHISASNKDNLDKIEPLPSASGEVVAKIKHKFETLDKSLSLMGKMYTSVPDIRELHDISPHLSHIPHCGSFVSHQYPRPEDNNRSLSSPDKSPPGIVVSKRDVHKKRPSSTSPIRSKTSCDVTKQLREIFSDPQSDSNMNRSRNRYLPDKQLEADYLWKKKHNQHIKSSSVSFKVDSIVPPTPPPLPIKNNYQLRFDNGYLSDSQKRYVESDVNIHYKAPVRYEYKTPIPDDELAYQQAEHMKKVYQEERRRKYLQELQDMSNRRHTDNFTPSQKSPIALNRYDDFGFDLPTSKSPVNLPGTVAKALYSFQGQSARELSFKKGDIIYIRRQIDKNWYEGEHNGAMGLLPVQYVDIISSDGARPPPRKPSDGQARAKYNFIAQSDIELSLNKGELVALTRRVDQNWFEGRIGNRKGIFPVTYVEVLTDIGSDDLENNILTTTTTTTFKEVSPSPLTPNSDIIRETKTIRKTEVLHVDTANEPITYRAMFNYRPVNSDELELREGDQIYVLEQCDDGWFVGTNTRNGFFGTFPGNYVKRVY